MLSESEWETLLSEALGCEVRVRYSRARRYVLRMQDLCSAPAAIRRPPGAGFLMRLHAFFGDAPADVRAAVCAWAVSGRRARRANAVLEAFIDEHVARLSREAPRPVRAELAGAHHDLEPLVERLVGEQFPSELARPEDLPTVTWGRRGRSRSRHSLQLGIYDYQARVVRIHRVLDQPAVPDWFVTYVLFHELLHAVLEGADGVRHHHGPAFRSREVAYPDYQRAVRWERRHLPALIRSARTGRALAARTARERIATANPERMATATPERLSLAQRVQQLLFPL